MIADDGPCALSPAAPGRSARTRPVSRLRRRTQPPAVEAVSVVSDGSRDASGAQSVQTSLGAWVADSDAIWWLTEHPIPLPSGAVVIDGHVFLRWDGIIHD